MEENNLASRKGPPLPNILIATIRKGLGIGLGPGIFLISLKRESPILGDFGTFGTSLHSFFLLLPWETLRWRRCL